jgi:hypothetical protein
MPCALAALEGGVLSEWRATPVLPGRWIRARLAGVRAA